MSNVSSVTNYFATANEGFATTLSGTIASGAATVPLTTTAGLTDGSVFVGIVEPGASAQQVFTGTVHVADNTITNVVWTRGTNVSHNTGVSVVDYTTGTAFNMMTTGILKSLTQAGKLNSLALAQIYPVGCLYIETTGTNPGTTFGFGTWVAFGQGRTLVGVGTSDQAFTAGQTGGESNHTLTWGEMPTHNHGVRRSGNESGGYGLTPPGTANGFSDRALITGPGQDNSTDNAGNSTPHNNLQPFVVVYFWKRTG